MNQIISSFVFLMLWACSGLLANPFSWADTIGGTGISNGDCMVADYENNLYVCGQMDGSFQPRGVNISGKDGFLIKYSSAGTLLWAIPLPGLTCKSVSIDAYQNACVAGYFSDTVHIGKVTLTSNGLHDYFIAKFDSLGNQIWAISGGGLGEDYAYSVANDLSGNTNITGSFEDYLNFDQNNSILSLGKGDMFVAEYDSAGKFVWAANGGGNGADAGTAVAVDLSDNVFVTGYFSGKTTFHNNTIQSNGAKDVFTVKYSPLGYQLNVVTGGGIGDDYPTAMSLDGSGNVYIAGVFYGTATFGNQSISGNAEDGFAVAYDNSLNINWINTMGSAGNDAALGIRSDWQSNIFVTGVFVDTADFNGQYVASKGQTDIFVVKYDAAGRLLWLARAGGTGADSAFSVYNDGNDIAYITGYIGAKADFGNINLAADRLGSFFIAQLKQDPAGIKTIVDNQAQLNVYPNPSNGNFNISGMSFANGNASLQVMDMTGKMIMSDIHVSPQNLNLSLENYPNGIYFLVLETDKGTYTEKLIKTENF